MNLHEVTSVPVGRKQTPRVGRGRGSGWGKTSRRGQKGASSRAGWGGGIMREGGQMPLFRRLPKKGFNNANFRVAFEVVNVETLQALGASGEVTPEVLKEAGLLKKSARWLKILGKGEVTAAVQVAAHRISAGARKKIEAVGGAVRLLSGPGGKPFAVYVPKVKKAPPRPAKAAKEEAPAEEAAPKKGKAPKAAAAKDAPPKAPKPKKSGS